MVSFTRHCLSHSDTGPALRALCKWTPTDGPHGGLHPGDVGWQLRFEDTVTLLWTDDDLPVAVGFLDGSVLRVSAAPDADLRVLAVDAEATAGPDADRCDGLPLPGWELDDSEPWLVMTWSPRSVSSRATAVGVSDAADRVLVQRSAFARSTFTLERWHAMKASPAGGLAVEVMVRTPTGQPAAAATGWFAGVGRCGLLEPVGTHPDHRGNGYGRDAVLGACAALAHRGATAVAVKTPSTNDAAVALYRSAGFTVVREDHDWIRRPRT